MKTLVAALALVAMTSACSSDRGDESDSGGGGVLCPPSFAPGVMIEVRDAVSGLPASCDTVCKAEGGGFIEVFTQYDCQSYPDFLYQSGIRSTGTYTITIERVGYQPWILGGIEVVSGVCGLVTVQLRADLIPL